MHTTIRQKYVVLFHLIFLLCITIRPKIRVHTNSFLLFAHDHSTKVYGPLSLILSFVHDHSRKIYGLLSFIWSSFIYFFFARPFDQKLRSKLIYFLICTGPFDQTLGSLLIYFFYLHTTTRPNYRVLFHLFFL